MCASLVQFRARIVIPAWFAEARRRRLAKRAVNCNGSSRVDTFRGVLQKAHAKNTHYTKIK